MSDTILPNIPENRKSNQSAWRLQANPPYAQGFRVVARLRQEVTPW